MTGRIRTRVAVVLAVIGMASEAGAAQTPDLSAVQQFEQRVSAYVALRRVVAIHTPPPAISSDSNAIVAAEDTLAEAIRAARPQARVGDIFTTQAAHAFRRRIEGVLQRNHRDLTDLLAEINGEAPFRSAQLTVNDRFDWQYGARMPGDLIEALPPLPGFLQYRFVNRDLLLIDIEADLIVDVLPDALAVKAQHRSDDPGTLAAVPLTPGAA
jgi:hypothetical protein